MTGSVKRLTVWKGGVVVGSLDETRSGLRFSYSSQLVERVGLDLPVISISMPTSNRPYFDRLARPFFDGLLPEGEARRIIAYDLRLSEADTFGLLRALGRDCAGALALGVEGDGPPRNEPIGVLSPLPTEALDALIRNLRFHPLGVDQDVRVSLAGMQEKLVLTALPGGRWALPSAAVASTHVLKPALSELANVVHNEALCLRFAAECGLAAANVRLDHFGGRDVLIVERFDRTVGADGVVRRTHQETACQALAVPVAASARKYEDAGGPSLRAVAGVVRRWAGTVPLVRLLQQLTLNMLVGNADAHAMNSSFVLGDRGEVTVSPLYDVFSTLSYPTLSTTPGMFVNGRADIRRVTRHDVVEEAVTWGLPAEQATSVVRDVCDRAVDAFERVANGDTSAPSELIEFLRARVTGFVVG